MGTMLACRVPPPLHSRLQAFKVSVKTGRSGGKK